MYNFIIVTNCGLMLNFIINSQLTIKNQKVQTVTKNQKTNSSFDMNYHSYYQTVNHFKSHVFLVNVLFYLQKCSFICDFNDSYFY